MEWQALEYQHRPKANEWYWWVGAAGLLVILLAAWWQNFLLIVFTAIATFTVMLLGARPPQTLTYSLLPKGIRLGQQLYPYDNLKSFWVIDEPVERRKIIIESQRFFMPHITIPLPTEVNADEVKQYLLAHLPEQKHDESIADIVGDALGF
jgi:hypothetical protein